jgi:hypothetical protein
MGSSLPFFRLHCHFDEKDSHFMVQKPILVSTHWICYDTVYTAVTAVRVAPTPRRRASVRESSPGEEAP